MVEQIHTDAVYDDPAPYSQGMVHNDIVRLAGQVPDDADGEIVGDDIETQTEQAVENIETLLDEAGSSMDSVISVTAYLTDMDDLESFNRVYRELFPDPKPARATVAVDELAVNARVELQATAAIE